MNLSANSITFHQLVLISFTLIIIMIALIVTLALLAPTTATHPDTIFPYLAEVTATP